jgi:hypothetical protein
VTYDDESAKLSHERTLVWFATHFANGAAR